MAIRNNKLGGTDFVKGEIQESVDINDTIDEAVELMQKLQAKNTFVYGL